MPRIGVRCPEMRYYLVGQTIQCHKKSPSFKIAYDEAIIVEWLIDEMGHIALPIRDAISTTKNCEGTGSGRLLG